MLGKDVWRPCESVKACGKAPVVQTLSSVIDLSYHSVRQVESMWKKQELPN